MIKVYYKVGSTKVFRDATRFVVDSDLGLSLLDADEMIGAVSPGCWETVVYVDEIDVVVPLKADVGTVIK